MPSRSPKSRKARPTPTLRKDRLIQTRVPEDLESTLKEEAARRRQTVSHLIRSVLEDTFHLVDNVVSDLDKVVTGSVDLARNVRRNAQRIAAVGQEAQKEPRKDWQKAVANVVGWNEVVLQRVATCMRCGDKMPKGDRAFTGLTDKPGPDRAWLCRDCIEAI